MLEIRSELRDGGGEEAAERNKAEDKHSKQSIEALMLYQNHRSAEMFGRESG